MASWRFRAAGLRIGKVDEPAVLRLGAEAIIAFPGRQGSVDAGVDKANEVSMEEALLPNDISQILTVGAAAVERGDYAGALPMFDSLYRKVPPDKYPFGLSYWGLC